MQRFNEQRRVFATVTKNGIAVLFAMWLMGGSNLLKKEIEFVCHMTDKTSADAMEILQAEGYIVHGKTGWTLTEGGQQMILAGSRNNSESIIINRDLIPLTLEITNNSINESEKFRVAELEKALDEAGIAEPTRSELTQIPGLTALHVTRWEKIKKREIGEADYKPGLLVWALRSLPDNPPIPDEPAETTPQHHKYTNGQFAAFIEA